jgi:hypothetical protein
VLPMPGNHVHAIPGGVTGNVAATLRRGPLLLLGAGALALLVLLQPDTARAQGCGVQMQTCASNSQTFCGGERIAGCLFQCCPDAGCCKFYDQFGVSGAQCCPGGPDVVTSCNPGCQVTCKTPCGPQRCCLGSLGEVCVPAADPNADGTCCSGKVCGMGTSSPTCCAASDVCTPSGACCPTAADVCGNDCCADGVCCNGQCCKAGSACYGNSVCCPQSLKPCGDNCCAKNEKCRHHKQKPPVCKCKKKGKKCGGTRCCAGDTCLDGFCAPPLP